MGTNLIEFNTVDFCYPHPDEAAPGAKALAGISVGIALGDYVALQGERGCGKTTFLKLCNALLLPDSGKVSFRGMDSSNAGLLREIRRGAAMVFQDPESQIIGTTVAEDVAFGPENLGLPPEAVRERVCDALQALSLQAHADAAVHLLTTGEKLRVALAGALAMQPDCLLLDDPAAPLDAGEKDELRQLLRTLNRERGITVLLATCDPEDAAEAHRVIQLQGGRITADGTPGRILTRPDDSGEPTAPSLAAEVAADRHGQRKAGAIWQAMLAGRYLPGASPLHRSDPRTKLALLLLLMATAFALATPAALAILLSITLALGALCGRPLLHTLMSLRPILWLALVAGAVQLFGAGGTPLTDHGALHHITREGVALSALMVLRLLLLAATASLLTGTTTPAALGDGVARVLRPLNRIGLPASQLATMLQVSLRLLPIIVAEAERLVRIRCTGRDGSTLRQRIASLPPLLVPLFACMARRGEAMAEAMEARCYGAGAGRTRMIPLAFSGADLTSVATLLVMLVAAAGVEYLQR